MSSRPRVGVSSPPSPDLIYMEEQVSGILIDTEGARLVELVGSISAAQETDAQSPAPRCGEHVPDAVADDDSLRGISPGKTVSYMDMARCVGPLATARMVASACADNPLALAIPCHRVVRGGGDLGGYRWGIERKRELIRKETTA
jgi:O-6-methylguanine DNA methyltransferase